MPWQRPSRLSAKMAGNFLNVMNEIVGAMKGALEKLNTEKEHIKKDSIRYFVEKSENHELKLILSSIKFPVRTILLSIMNLINMSKTCDCERNLSSMISIGNHTYDINR